MDITRVNRNIFAVLCERWKTSGMLRLRVVFIILIILFMYIITFNTYAIKNECYGSFQGNDYTYVCPENQHDNDFCLKFKHNDTQNSCSSMISFWVDRDPGKKAGYVILCLNGSGQYLNFFKLRVMMDGVSYGPYNLGSQVCTDGIPVNNERTKVELIIKQDGVSDLPFPDIYLHDIKLQDVNLVTPSQCCKDSCAIYYPIKVCSGSVNIAYVNPTKDCTYNWSISGGRIISGFHKNIINWTAGNSDSVTLELNITNKDGSKCPSCSKKIEVVPIGKTSFTLNPNNISTNNLGNCNCSTIYLENGTYVGPLKIVSDDIELKSKFKWGANITSDSKMRAIELVNKSNVHIEDLNILSNNTGIRIYNSTFCSISENKIYFNNNDTHKYNNSSGFYIDFSSNNSLIDNEIYYTGKYDNSVAGMCLRNSNYNIIKGTKFYNITKGISYCDNFNMINSYGNLIKHTILGRIRINNNNLICCPKELSNMKNRTCIDNKNINESGNTWTLE